MPIEATASIEHSGRRTQRRSLSTGSVREIEVVLRSWGLGDRHASVACSWVVAEASSCLANDRLRLVEPAGAAEDRRRMAYVRAVAAIFARATGKDPARSAGDRERHSFEEFIIACLRLVMPAATPEELQAVRRRSVRPLDA